jgi:hypothetical protein
VMFVNDEASYLVETPEQRWERVRAWAESKVAAPRVGPERGDG